MNPDTSLDLITAAEFLALRADWYAQGRPTDHPYHAIMTAPAPPRTWVDPMVTF